MILKTDPIILAYAPVCDVDSDALYAHGLLRAIDRRIAYHTERIDDISLQEQLKQIHRDAYFELLTAKRLATEYHAKMLAGDSV